MSDAEPGERERPPAEGDVTEPTEQERRQKWADDAESSETIQPPDTEESIRDDDGEFPMGLTGGGPIALAR